MDSSARAVSFCLLLGACAASQERPPGSTPPAVVPVPVAAPSAPASASASASVASAPRLPPLPPAIDEATGAVCSYRSSGESNVQVGLFLPGKEKPFATIWSPKVSVAMPPSEQASPVVQVTSAHLDIRAQTRAEVLDFYAQAPLVMGDVMVPSGSTPLRVSRVGSGDLTVRWTPAFSGLTLTPAQQERAVACGDLGLEPSKLDPKDVVPDTSKARRVALREGQTFALRATEKGAPVVEVRTEKAPRPSSKGPRAIPVGSVFTPQVWVAKTSGSQSLVVLASSGSRLFGWVPSAMLEPPTQASIGALFGMSGLGSLMAAAEPALRDHRVLCEADIPLLGEQEGTRVTLGALRSSVCMNLREQGAEFSRVGVYNLELKTTESSRLLVPTAALAGCRPVPAEGALPNPCEGLASDETQDLWGGLGLGTGLGGFGGGIGGLGAGKGTNQGLGGPGLGGDPPAKSGKDKGPRPRKK